MKKKIILLASLCLIMVGAGYAQTKGSEPFPQFKGNDLNDRDLIFPNIAMGKYTVMGAVASQDAVDGLLEWYQPIADNFAWDEEINTYFVVLMGGMAQNMSFSLQKKLKEVVLEEYYEKVIFFKGNLRNMLEKIDIKDKSVPYFFVLDEKGKIAYMTSGKYSDQKLDEIVMAVDGEIYIDRED